jgi:ABC-type dipeptide/oligopeptide/nickel transport system ATPase component
MQIILLVGLSGSGKTTLAKKIMGSSELPFYVINDDGDDEKANFQESDKVKKIQWKECDGLRDCGLIFEDVLNATKEQFKIIKQFACVAAHHDRVSPLIIICHAVLGNNLYGILANLTQVHFTLAKSNVKSLRSVLEYYRVSQKTKEEAEKTFLACTDEYGHFVYNVSNMLFERGDMVAEKKSGSKSGGENTRFPPPHRFLELMPRPQEAALLYDLIYQNLPPAVTASGGYTLKMKCSTSGIPVTLNFMDYINCLVDERKKPSRQMRSVHKFVTRIVPLPECIIPNRHFL